MCPQPRREVRNPWMCWLLGPSAAAQTGEGSGACSVHHPSAKLARCRRPPSPLNGTGSGLSLHDKRIYPEPSIAVKREEQAEEAAPSPTPSTPHPIAQSPQEPLAHQAEASARPAAGASPQRVRLETGTARTPSVMPALGSTLAVAILALLAVSATTSAAAARLLPQPAAAVLPSAAAVGRRLAQCSAQCPEPGGVHRLCTRLCMHKQVAWRMAPTCPFPTPAPPTRSSPPPVAAAAAAACSALDQAKQDEIRNKLISSCSSVALSASKGGLRRLRFSGVWSGFGGSVA